MIRLHDDLSSSSLDLDPVAPFTGPFPRRGFVGAWAAHRSVALLVAESESAAIVMWDDDGVIRLAGESDLTDYHSPLGTGVADLVAELPESLGSGTRLHFDSLPKSASDAIVVGLGLAGVDAAPDQHEVAAVMALGATHDDYLAGLDKKQRHEVRRKRRRFGDSYGEPGLDRRPDDLERFVEMHRSAPGDKGEFMTDEMAGFFAGLLDAGFALDFLVAEDGTPLAAGFGFEDDDGYYLYNSAFDPDAGHASPGVVLVDLLIEQAIEAGKRRFDFLKGDEVYKFRLGATARPLYAIEVTL